MCDQDKRLNDPIISYSQAMECLAGHFVYWIEQEDMTISEANKALQADIDDAIVEQVKHMRAEVTKDFDHKWSRWIIED